MGWVSRLGVGYSNDSDSDDFQTEGLSHVILNTSLGRRAGDVRGEMVAACESQQRRWRRGFRPVSHDCRESLALTYYELADFGARHLCIAKMQLKQNRLRVCLTDPCSGGSIFDFPGIP